MNRAFLWRWRRLRVYLIPCMVAAAVCLPSLFGEKWISDTGMYTAVSLKAVREGHWWTLHLASGPYFNKPPLPFWIHAAVLKVFGVHSWSIKLPEYLAVIGCVLLTVKLARMWSPPRVAMLAGIVLACTPQFVLLVDSFRLDYLHTLWLLSAVVCVAKGVKRFDVRGQSGIGWIALSGVPIGCALMTKPLWGLIVYVVLAAWLAGAGGRRWRLIAWLPAGVLVAAAVALPWHVSMQWLHGEVFWQTYFERQIVRRARGEMGPQGEWYWYLEFLGRTYWPWLPFVGLAGAGSLIGKPISRDKAGTRLAWTWVVGMLLLLSVFPGKNRYYIYHLYPVLAWLSAMAFGQLIKPGWRRVMDFAVLVPVAAGLMIGVARLADFDDLSRHLAMNALGRSKPDQAVVCAAVLICLAVWRWYRVIERRALGAAAAVLLAGAAAFVPAQERRGHPFPRHWGALHEWVREEVGSGRVPAERLYNGSLHYNMSARIYVMEGVWPVTSTWNNSPPPEPEAGGGPAWLIFDVNNREESNRPREGDVEVFRERQLVVVRRDGPSR